MRANRTDLVDITSIKPLSVISALNGGQLMPSESKPVLLIAQRPRPTYLLRIQFGGQRCKVNPVKRDTKAGFRPDVTTSGSEIELHERMIFVIRYRLANRRHDICHAKRV